VAGGRYAIERHLSVEVTNVARSVSIVSNNSSCIAFEFGDVREIVVRSLTTFLPPYSAIRTTLINKSVDFEIRYWNWIEYPPLRNRKCHLPILKATTTLPGCLGVITASILRMEI
jgi:hypothetical protein